MNKPVQKRWKTKYRTKPIVIEASRWFKNGDHPKDLSRRLEDADGPFLSEGKVVRRFCRPDNPGITPCEHCRVAMWHHGWIDTKEGGHIVCPGDFIITGVQGERYPSKPDIFAATYDLEPEQ